MASNRIGASLYTTAVRLVLRADCAVVSVQEGELRVYPSAASLDLPTGAHCNKSPFRGVLTRIGAASDRLPNGSGGKRVLLTMAAAQAALHTLLGMPIGVAERFDAHNVRNRVGIITAAHIDGNALMVEGHIFCQDNPDVALQIREHQADLGFSFEASNLVVDASAADPMIVKSLTFTGAAILMKREAAWMATGIAASRDRSADVSEVNYDANAIAQAVDAAFQPLRATLTEVAAAQTAIEREIRALHRRW